MKRYLFFTLLCFINIVCVYSQLNNKVHVEFGSFVCRANQYIIYMESEIDSEYPTIAIKAINLNSNERIVLGKESKNTCVNMSDTAILYINGSNLMLWDLKSKSKAIYYKANKGMNIIGVSYCKKTSSLLLTQFNFKTEELFVEILNGRKQIVFSRKIKVNEMELEGVTPVLSVLDHFFIFSTQDKLYSIDSKNLEFKLISNKCNGYALSNGKVIYYKFITDGRTEGYSIDLSTGESRKVDNSLNEKLYNCQRSSLFTANIDNIFFSTYTICNKPYLWVNNNWKIASEVLVFRDNKLIVKMPFENGVIKDDYFQWELR